MDIVLLVHHVGSSGEFVGQELSVVTLETVNQLCALLEILNLSHQEASGCLMGSWDYVRESETYQKMMDFRSSMRSRISEGENIVVVQVLHAEDLNLRISSGVTLLK